MEKASVETIEHSRDEYSQRTAGNFATPFKEDDAFSCDIATELSKGVENSKQLLRLVEPKGSGPEQSLSAFVPFENVLSLQKPKDTERLSALSPEQETQTVAQAELSAKDPTNSLPSSMPPSQGRVGTAAHLDVLANIANEAELPFVQASAELLIVISTDQSTKEQSQAQYSALGFSLDKGLPLVGANSTHEEGASESYDSAHQNIKKPPSMTKKRRRPKKTNACQANEQAGEDEEMFHMETFNFWVQLWEKWNAHSAQSPNELWDQCCNSEAVVVLALHTLKGYHKTRFVEALNHRGYQVRDKGIHCRRFVDFGHKLPEDYPGGVPERPVPQEEKEALYQSPQRYLTSLINSEGKNHNGDPPTAELLRIIKNALSAPVSSSKIKNDKFNPLQQNSLQREILSANERFDQLQNVSQIPQIPQVTALSQSALELPFTYFERLVNQSSPQSSSNLSFSTSSLETSSISFEFDQTEILDQLHDFEVQPKYSEGSSKEINTQLDESKEQINLEFIGTMSTSQVAFPLPVLPEEWSGEKDFKAIGRVSAATQRSIEPVGPYFLAHARRARHKRTFSEDDRIQAQENVKKTEDDDTGEISEPEDPMMLSRDAKDWKGQDHYAVLGLSKYRYKATEEQIKRAHRKKVLRHHPDKKAAAGSTEDDSFFKCIQKATEILLDPVKRRQYDSVDEHADVEPPTKKQTQKGNFYKLWGPVFKSEARFSKIQPVPKLGDEKSTKEDVENFYNFWYNFDSWRSFEYQDEDVPDDNENRDQKRHMERKNNNARKKKKTEDSARLRKLLDDASALDERIKKFRQEANAEKNKKRIEKEAAEKKAAEDAKAKKLAEEQAAKEAEEVAKVEREQGKKAKEAAKNAVKKNKRILKGSVKDANYFVTGDASASKIDGVLNDVEFIQAKIDPDEIAALAGKLSGLKVADEIKAVWSGEVKRLVEAGKLKSGDAKNLA